MNINGIDDRTDSMNTPFTIACDLDGCLADFENGVLQLCGKPMQEISPKSTMWKAIQQHMDDGNEFFGSLQKLPDAQQLIQHLLMLDNDLFILTATGHINPEQVSQEKTRWAHANVSADVTVITVRRGTHKAEYANTRTILIDDNALVMDAWVTAGGIGILHSSAESTISQLRQILDK